MATWYFVSRWTEDESDSFGICEIEVVKETEHFLTIREKNSWGNRNFTRRTRKNRSHFPTREAALGEVLRYTTRYLASKRETLHNLPAEIAELEVRERAIRAAIEACKTD